MDSIVYLIGAGPGDPGLLTVKGQNLLKTADVIIYDSLINKKLLNHCKKTAKLIYVGKTPGKREITQKEINRKLIYYSKRKKIVARLKGGDPFIFGRGGEEAEALVNAGITIEVVPGVSSISSVPGYSGVPLTHRKYNSSFTVITGHENPYKLNSKLDWKSISNQDTLVFLMSLKNITLIMKKLIERKMPRSTPVLVTSWGTIPRQKSLIGTVENISKIIQNEQKIQSPAIILVGKIVNLKKSISWYEKKPLFGKNIVITRAENQAADFYDLLTSFGANVIEFPTIETVDVKTFNKIDKAIREIKKYNYIIFTSVNGVNYFFSRVFKKNLDSRIFYGKKIVAIGEKTGSELRKYGITPDILPSKYTAEGILTKLDRSEIKKSSFLIPRAKIARDLIPKTLRKLNCTVTVVECYETVIPKIKNSAKKEFIEMLKSNSIDLVTFTSSSTVTNMLKLLGKESHLLNNTKLASIGPITSDTLITSGFNPEITAKKHTIEGLFSEIMKYYSN